MPPLDQRPDPVERLNPLHPSQISDAPARSDEGDRPKTSGAQASSAQAAGAPTDHLKAAGNQPEAITAQLSANSAHPSDQPPAEPTIPTQSKRGQPEPTKISSKSSASKSSAKPVGSFVPAKERSKLTGFASLHKQLRTTPPRLAPGLSVEQLNQQLAQRSSEAIAPPPPNSPSQASQASQISAVPSSPSEAASRQPNLTDSTPEPITPGATPAPPAPIAAAPTAPVRPTVPSNPLGHLELPPNYWEEPRLHPRENPTGENLPWAATPTQPEASRSERVQAEFPRSEFPQIPPLQPPAFSPAPTELESATFYTAPLHTPRPPTAQRAEALEANRLASHLRNSQAEGRGDSRGDSRLSDRHPDRLGRGLTAQQSRAMTARTQVPGADRARSLAPSPTALSRPAHLLTRLRQLGNHISRHISRQISRPVSQKINRQTSRSMNKQINESVQNQHFLHSKSMVALLLVTTGIILRGLMKWISYVTPAIAPALVILAIIPTVIAVYLTFFVPQGNDAPIYRAFLMTLGLFLGGLW